jgi:putative transposase
LETELPEKTRLETTAPKFSKKTTRLKTATPGFFVNCYGKARIMEKKESYRHILPHFQQPGQAYFVTWNLKDAVPPKALVRYTKKLEMLRNEIARLKNAASNKMRLETAAPGTTSAIDKLKLEYNLVRKKYIKAYDDLLDAARNPAIDLSKTKNLNIMIESLQFWENKRLMNIAFTVMPNHVHWVFQLFEKDNEGKPVYLQDILHSVKRFSSNRINKVENREGALWQKESFDTTIRDDKHMYYAIRYTLNNPVKAGLVSEWHNWAGTWNGATGCRDL